MSRLGRSTRALLATCLLIVPVARAHPPERPQKREIIRLQGHVRPDGDAPAGRLTLIALGADHPFAATDRRIFSLGPDDPGPGADRYALQGPREELARFAAAKPEQTVTILAEHHPGSKDLFLLAVDLCPAP